MPVLVHISITPQTIELQTPGTSHTLAFDNCVAYDRTRLRLLHYGKREDALKAELGSDWAAFRKQAVFTSLFNPQETGPIFDYQVLELLLTKMRELHNRHKFRSTIPYFYQPLKLDIQIPNYQSLSLGRQRELEYYLQDVQRAESLTINGENRTIPKSLRKTQALSNMIFRILIPSILLLMAFLEPFSQWQSDLTSSFSNAGIWLAGAVLAYFSGTVCWLLVFRTHLPHGYLRYQLRFTGLLLRKPTRWLADKLL